jgi:hypothetical protein
MKRRTPEVCPVCGENVPRGAEACPECGACHESGWKEDAHIYDGVDFLEEGETDDSGRVRWSREDGPRMHPFWRLVAIIVVVALSIGLLRWLWGVGSARWF